MKKQSRGYLGYIILLGTLLVIAILLNGGLNQTVSKRIEYPKLLEMIESGKVGWQEVMREFYHDGGRRFPGEEL